MNALSYDSYLSQISVGTRLIISRTGKEKQGHFRLSFKTAEGKPIRLPNGEPETVVHEEYLCLIIDILKHRQNLTIRPEEEHPQEQNAHVIVFIEKTQSI